NCMTRSTAVQILLTLPDQCKCCPILGMPMLMLQMNISDHTAIAFAMPLMLFLQRQSSWQKADYITMDTETRQLQRTGDREEFTAQLGKPTMAAAGSMRPLVTTWAQITVTLF